jgi:formylglycine-generating enzyme
MVLAAGLARQANSPWGVKRRAGGALLAALAVVFPLASAGDNVADRSSAIEPSTMDRIVESIPAGSAVPVPVPSASCPADMVLVDGEFCPVMPYPCRREAPFGARGRCAEYSRDAHCDVALVPKRYCVDRYEWPNQVGENPKVFVDWNEAKQLCRSVGKRLCSRTEWMFACEGPKRLPYPWGYVRHPSPCNVDHTPIPFDIEAMMDPKRREQELERLWQADPSGSHPNCVSAWGAFDMSGNVDEWTDDAADNPTTEHPSTLNGGYWGPVRDTCRLATTSHGPTFRFYQVGFRCCGDALPK